MKFPFCRYIFIVNLSVCLRDIVSKRRQMTSSNVVFLTSLVRDDALNENRNVVFIWSAAMCFIFVAPINVIFIRPLYESDI